MPPSSRIASYRCTSYDWSGRRVVRVRRRPDTLAAYAYYPRRPALEAEPCAPAAEATPEIEYPREDETIVSSGYTFRFSAPPEAHQVEVSIDQGPWRPCRSESGRWWYDWAGYGEGTHEVAVRALDKTSARAVVVAALPR